MATQYDLKNAYKQILDCKPIDSYDTLCEVCKDKRRLAFRDLEKNIDKFEYTDDEKEIIQDQLENFKNDVLSTPSYEKRVRKAVYFGISTLKDFSAAAMKEINDDLLTTDPEDVYEKLDGYIKKYEMYSIGYIRAFIRKSKYSEEEKENLLAKTDIYTETIEKMKKQDIVEDAENIINELLSSETKSNKAFLKTRPMENGVLEKSVQIVKENNIGLYNEYKDLLRRQRATRYAIVLGKIMKLTNRFEKYVEDENGNKRKFDIIDYFSYTKLDFATLKRLIEGSGNVEEYRSAMQFIRSNEGGDIDAPQCKKEILNVKSEVECELDSRGFPIPGTGRELQKEEKEQIFEFLTDNNIPVNRLTYHTALRRTLNKTLDITKRKEIDEMLKDPIVEESKEIIAEENDNKNY